MSRQFFISQSFPNNDSNNFINNSNQNLIPYIDISKGKIITLLKTVFSFLNDNSLLKNESSSSFEKYTIDNKFIQTMSKIFYFYTSNYPENGKIALHELIKERYSKFLKYYEQNINFLSNCKELQFRYYEIQGFILLWLAETNYCAEYYDDLIRVVNGIIGLDKDNEENKYLKNFLKAIIKFPFIKQNKEMIIKVLEVNECNDSIINYFNDNLDNFIQKKNSIFKQDLLNQESSLNLGKKNIETKNQDSSLQLIKGISSISYKRKSLSNSSSQKGLFTINSSGFYTPEFKHSKRNSIKHYRRFTMNNINNPKASISNKNNSYSRANSMSVGMNNLLIKCEEGKHKNNSINSLNNKNKNAPESTKSKLRLAVQGHFYTDDDYKNNIEMGVSTSKFSLNNSINQKDTNTLDNNNIFENDIYDSENEIENKIVSVDELPINISILSNANSKNIGIEPENIIQETKEEEEVDDNEQINNTNISHNKNYVKILTDNEINDFFNQQFSDNKNKNNEQQINKINKPNNNKNNIINDNKKKYQNKNKKRNNSNNSENNSSRNNSLNHIVLNKNKKNVISKERKNSEKDLTINSNLFKGKNKEKNKSENNNISVQERMKNYSNSNVFGILKNHKNNKKDIIGLKNKNENIILQPCTKGKELVDNTLNSHNMGNVKISKEKLPTDSVAKQNMLSLYNQLKAKK